MKWFLLDLLHIIVHYSSILRRWSRFLQKLLLEVRCIYSFLNVDFHISIKSWKGDTPEKGLKEAIDEVA